MGCVAVLLSRKMMTTAMQPIHCPLKCFLVYTDAATRRLAIGLEPVLREWSNETEEDDEDEEELEGGGDDEV